MSMVCQCGSGLAGGFSGGSNLSLVASMASAFALPYYKFPALHLHVGPLFTRAVFRGGRGAFAPPGLLLPPPP